MLQLHNSSHHCFLIGFICILYVSCAELLKMILRFPFFPQAYSEGSIGVDISEADQIDYNTWFAGLVHEYGMRVGIKNLVQLADVLEPYFDFALNEECFQWNECEVRHYLC